MHISDLYGMSVLYLGLLVRLTYAAVIKAYVRKVSYQLRHPS